MKNGSRGSRFLFGQEESGRLVPARCDQASITAHVSRPMTWGAKADGRFDKADFVYEPDTDTYRCPAGRQLIRRFARVEDGYLIHRYRGSDCPRCAIKAQCTPSDYRRVRRCEHKASLDRCKGGLMANRVRCESEDRQLNTPLAPSISGWARDTSGAHARRCANQ